MWTWTHVMYATPITNEKIKIKFHIAKKGTEAQTRALTECA